MSDSSLPTFLVIGAQKAGTTWLYEMLRQHPQVGCAHPKELFFFSSAAVHGRGLDWYADQFSAHAGKPARGEFTPNYFWTSEDPAVIRDEGMVEHIPQLVRASLPEVKLVVSLRHPVDRAVSAYLHHIAKGRIRDGESILDARHRYGIATMGDYAAHVRRWLQHFPRERFLLLVYETDFTDANKGRTLRRVFEHIGVDPEFKPAGIDTVFNGSPTPLDLRLGGLPEMIRRPISKLTRWAWRGEKPGLARVTVSERRELAQSYQPQLAELQSLIGQPLPWVF